MKLQLAIICPNSFTSFFYNLQWNFGKKRMKLQMNKNKNINSYRNFGFIVLGSWWQLGQKRNFLFKSNSKSTLKVEEILKGGLDLTPSPTPSVKIQIMGRKVCLRCKGKTLLGFVNKLVFKSLLTSSSYVLTYYLK